QAEAALRGAEARLAQMRILAPASGVILRREVEPGDVVQPAHTLLVLLVDGATEISIAPDERSLATLRIGQHALASTEAFPERTFDATVRYIAPAIDAQRGTVEVRLRVETPPDYIRPDMTASVEIEVGRVQSALTLPTDALHDAGTRRPWVLSLGADGRVARRDVRLGVRGERTTEIQGGVREGDRVLVGSNTATLTIGQRVRVRESSGTQGGRTAAAR
ncbi:MAG: efflux RND transporter periplasmic adaptor subunit, partial [Deltaproteobacteria bacterium]